MVFMLIVLAIIEGSLLTDVSLTEDGFESIVYSITRISDSNIAAAPLALYGCFLQGLLIFIFHHYAKLTSGEDELCSVILHRAKHSHRCDKAAKLIQQWWRERERHPERMTSPSFVSHNHDLQYTKDRSHPSYFTLQKQVFLLEKGINAKIQTTKEGIKEAEMGALKQLHTLIRANYRILVICSSLRKFSLNPKTQSRFCIQMRQHQLSIISEEASSHTSSRFSTD
jgi:hypothetical protein